MDTMSHKIIQDITMVENNVKSQNREMNRCEPSLGSKIHFIIDSKTLLKGVQITY